MSITQNNISNKLENGVSPTSSTSSSSGHKGSLRGTKIAKRARSFKDDFLEKISQMRTPSSTLTRNHSPSNSPRNNHSSHHHHLHNTLNSSKSSKGFDDGMLLTPTGKNNSMVNNNYHKTLPSSLKPALDLDSQIRQVKSSLKHFNDVVSKNKLEMLPGNGTIILENFADVHTALQAYALNENSSALSSAKRQVHSALGELIKLCDEFWLHELKLVGRDMIDGISDESEAKKVKELKVKEVTHLMESALQNLIQVSNEKLEEQQKQPKEDNSNDQDGNFLQRPTVDVAGQRTSLPDIPLTPRERDSLQSKANSYNLVRGSHSIESILCDNSPSPQPPPPKPPLPNRLTDPPPLPPKKKTIQYQQQFSYPLLDNINQDQLNISCSGGQERNSWRSKSPEDNSSLLSASAGSLDSSTLNQSRDDEEEEDEENEEDVEEEETGLFELEQQLNTSVCPRSPIQYRQLEENTSPISSSQNLLLQLPTDSGQLELLSNGNDPLLLQSNMNVRSVQTVSKSMAASASSTSFSSSSKQNTTFTKQTYTTVQKYTSMESSSLSSSFSVYSSDSFNRFLSFNGANLADQPPPIPSRREDEGERNDELPPKLPLKTRKSTRERHKSVYDNMPNQMRMPSEHNSFEDLIDGERSPGPTFLQHTHHMAITKHQSVFEPRQLQSFRAPQNNQLTDGDEPPPLPVKKRHMFQSVAYSVMAYMEMIGNCSAAHHHGAMPAELLSYDARAITSAEFQQRSVSMMPTIGNSSHLSTFTAGSSSTTTISSSATFSSSTTQSASLTGAISNLSVDEKPPALPPKRGSRHSSKSGSSGCGLMQPSMSTSSPPPSPKISVTLPKETSPQPLIKNISSLSPVICDVNSPSSKHLDKDDDVFISQPNSSQLYKQMSQPQNEKQFTVPEDEMEVVLRRDVNKKESKSNRLNLMEEMDMQKYLVVKKDGEDGPDIKGGHLDALIIHATKVEKWKGELSDSAFGEAFITTFRTFISPFELLKKLTYRYEIFHCQVTDQKQRTAKEAFSLLVRVVNDLTMQDIDECSLKLLMDFIYQLICNGNLSMAKVLRVQLMSKVKQHPKTYSNDPLSSRGVTTNPPSLLDLKSSDIAEQMTLLDSELFQKIEIPEVLLWAQEQCEERSPNLTKFTEHFNKMSYWARSQILKQEDSKERERYVIKFIKIMKHLRKINNYNSYLALLSALDSAPIRRLEWHKTITEGLKEYCALIDSSSSFRAYRLALAETNPPCIPYIGLVLQDLTFVHIGNPDYLTDEIINFSKRWQQYNIVVNMKRFKKSAYPYKKNERIIGFFENFENYLDEDAMWQISETIKPRGGKKLQNLK